MDAVGIVCEYNPFHNGHIYHIKEIKKLYPKSVIVLVLNGYFLERGEVSILSKENKVKLSLCYGVDLVVELPFLYGSQSADIFAEAAIKILHELNCSVVVFGSELNKVEVLEKVVDIENSDGYQARVKEFIDRGLNYPTALAKALNIEDDVFNPNDLLGISYIKAIKKNKYSMRAVTIKRTNDFHDLSLDTGIISASNIREKIRLKKDISSFVPRRVVKLIEDISLEDFFLILKYKILTSDNLDSFLTVSEGIENRLKEKILEARSVDELINKVKTKRYTYNKIRRMLIHILVGVPKNINELTQIDYIKILGFNKLGRKYLHDLRDEVNISLIPNYNSKVYQFELRASYVYGLISKNDVLSFEASNKPIYFDL